MTTMQPVLVVEDDEGHAYLIKKNLAASGIANPVIRFASGDAAIDYLTSAPADELPILMLLDLNMPGTNGVQVLEWVRGNARFHLLPVIILTTTDQPVEVQQCYELGCSLYLAKPVDPRAFMDAVRSLGLLLRISKGPALSGSAAHARQ